MLTAMGTYYLVRYLTADRRAAASVGDLLRVLSVSVRAHGAHPVVDDRRPAVLHARVSPDGRSADGGSRCGSGRRHGGASAVLRLLRRVRDADDRLRDDRRRGRAAALDRSRVLVCGRHWCRRCARHRRPALPAIPVAAARPRVQPLAERRARVFGELERVPRELLMHMRGSCDSCRRGAPR